MSGGGNGRDDGYKPTPSPVVKPGGTGAGGGGGGDDDPCNIVEIVPLNSPQPAVVATLSVGGVLDVNLNKQGPNPVLEVLANGQRAGALTHRNHVRIIACIDAGRAYRAVVVSIRGGSVEVRIEPA
jgi:hypothetical protein